MIAHLIFLLCLSTVAANPKNLRSRQEIISFPLTVHATVFPPPAFAGNDQELHAAQCLISSFQSIQPPLQSRSDPQYSLSTTRVYQVLGDTQQQQVHAATIEPVAKASESASAAVVEESQSPGTPVPPDSEEPAFGVGLEDEDEDEDSSAFLAVLQSIADYILAFLVKLGIFKPSSSITVSPAPPTTPPTEIDRLSPSPLVLEDGCVLCWDDDTEDALSMVGIATNTAPADAVAPTAAMLDTASDASCGPLCPEDDDHIYKPPTRRALDTTSRAMWTFDALLEAVTTRNNSDSEHAVFLYDRFEHQTDILLWSDVFCECFSGDSLHPIPVCQIHVLRKE